MNRITGLITGLMLLVMTPAFAEDAATQDVYKIDGAHSTIGFRIKHLGISFVNGKFDKFDGQLTFEGEKLVSIEGTVEANSINTANEKRDTHLKSDDFFGAEQFPTIKFKSTKVTQEGSKLGIVGELTIRDVTKIVEFQGEFGGLVYMENMKVHKAGVTLEGQINRQDFNLKFNKVLESGQAIVGNDVMIDLELEANRQ